VKSAGHMPKNVILQHNFETGGRNVQLGKGRPTWDYWLSYVGPSELFRNCAKAAVRCGTRVSAKLQVSCSHEVATTQVVPVPGHPLPEIPAHASIGGQFRHAFLVLRHLSFAHDPGCGNALL